MLQEQVRELQRLLGKKTLENEILREALNPPAKKRLLRWPSSGRGGAPRSAWWSRSRRDLALGDFSRWRLSPARWLRQCSRIWIGQPLTSGNMATLLE